MGTQASFCLLGIGRELLDGRILNTNATHFASILKERGALVEEIRAIDDEVPQIAKCLQELSHFSCVIVTGGLGPTMDDITSVAAAKAFGVEPVHSKEMEKIIKRQLAIESQLYTDEQASQAQVPEGASPIDNKWGIAPGFSYTYKACTYFFLPGVPKECLPMFREIVFPRIEKEFSLVRTKEVMVWRCFGDKEANIYHRIAPILNRAKEKHPQSFHFSCLVPYPSVDVRVKFLSAKDCPSVEERKAFQKAIDKELHRFIYATEELSVAEIVFKYLKAHSLTLATAESCTGGLLGKMLTDVPGASECYMGGVISYSNSVKEKCLGVSPSSLERYGAVSKEVALEMALGARTYFKSDYAISITGVAGPEGGSKEKPIGTVFFGIASPKGTKIEHCFIKKGSGNREQNRTYASNFALHMLRSSLTA